MADKLLKFLIKSVPSGGRAFVWITISGDKSSLPANHWPLVTNY